jgi:signal peptidase I
MVVDPMIQLGSKAQQELASIRDTVESIWVAIVLAFVLRAFVVEAFVIPTGSMAPRLMGEHLDVRCPACGYEYAFGWSTGDEEQFREVHGTAAGQRATMAPVCPTCRYVMDDRLKARLAGGDRVLVMKYVYRFRKPEPWDVVVFKNPQDNRQNYIKRLIGLPGEQIEIVHGDVFVRRNGDGQFRIRRKGKQKTQDAMWHVLFDTDYRNRYRRDDVDAPPAWRPVGDQARRLWQRAALQGRRLRFDGADSKAFHQLVFKGDANSFLPRYGYNSSIDAARDLDVISDLKLVAAWFPESPDSRVALELTSFDYQFRGELAADGTARLLHRRDGDTDWTEWARNGFTPPATGRGCEVALTHVDFRVTLWVDGKAVAVSPDRRDNDKPDDRRIYPLDYRLLKQKLTAILGAPDGRVPTPSVKIGAAGGPCELRHVRLLRDVYYTCPSLPRDPSGTSVGDFARDFGVVRNSPGWAVMGHPIRLAEYPDQPDLNQYFVLGDNSPSSLDGRLWTSAAVTLRLYDESGAVGSPLLDATMIQWKPLVAKLEAQAGADGPSPGKRLVHLLDDEAKAALADLSEALLDGDGGYVSDYDLTRMKGAVVRGLNRLLGAGVLYEARAWRAVGADLPGQARTLVDQRAKGTKLSVDQQQTVGRLALEAAFGDEISRRRRTYQLGTVPRYSLIGKAIFVYWPAGFPLPGLPHLPIVPNVGNMRLIR